MKKLLELLKPYRKLLATVAVADALGVFTSLLMPYVMSEIVNSGIAKSNTGVILNSVAIMLALSLLSVLSSLTANRINARVTTRYTEDICALTFKKINSLSYGEYSRIGPSGLLTRATDDIFNIEGAASSLVYTLVTVPIMVIGSVVLAFLADARLASVFMLSIPAVLLIVLIFMKPLYGMWDKSDKYVDEQNRIIRERLSGIRVVRAFNNEDNEHARAKKATEEMSKYMIRANVRGGLIEPFAMLLFNVATVAVIVIGGLRAESGDGGKAGDVIAIIQYVALLSGALLNLSWSLAWMPRLKVSLKRINEVISAVSELESPCEAERGEEALTPARIELKNITFTYPEAGAPTLKNLSIEVEAGERVAIIGGTGSGKTTLVRLLTGLFEPDSGEIILNGSPTDNNKALLRKSVSVSLQKAMIFEGTIRDNLTLAAPSASDEELVSALRDSCMGDFLDSHEEGLDYFLVGLGQNLSGGQKQRLNIARAVMKRASVYIFDDSFSALDFLTEKTLRENLRKRIGGYTEITVTQRAATAMAQDRIYVIDGGEISGCGTHEELLRGNEIYRKICLSQLGQAVLEVNDNDR